MGRTVVMVAKEPVPGRCKTRLCPPLLPEEAAGLYAGFLADLMQRLADLAAAGIQAGIAYTPESSPRWFARHAPPGLELFPQEGADLGQRLDGIARRCLARGGGPVVILSSDSPTLPPDLLPAALDRLAEADVVLGPCEDGGYYLVGLRAYTPQIFAGIAWSTPLVLGQTLAQAAAAGLRTALLPRWYDVDSAADLNRLVREVGSGPGATAHPQTAAAVRRLAAAGRVPGWPETGAAAAAGGAP